MNASSIESALNICPHCGHANRAGAKFCTQCGSALPAVITVEPTGGLQSARTNNAASMAASGKKWCPRCGARRRATAKVCSTCGYRFGDAANGGTDGLRANPPASSASASPAPTLPPVPTIMPAPISQSVVVKTPPGLSGEAAPYLPGEVFEQIRRASQDGKKSTQRVRPMVRRILRTVLPDEDQ